MTVKELQEVLAILNPKGEINGLRVKLKVEDPDGIITRYYPEFIKVESDDIWRWLEMY